MKKRRRSPGCERADLYYDLAKTELRRAKEARCPEAERLADLAISAAMNSRSGYEASHGLGGGSGRAWSLRSRGAMWAKKARKLIDEARAALAAAEAEQREG